MTAVYDVANWKPITSEQFVRELCNSIYSMGDDVAQLAVKVDGPLSDGRSRFIVEANTSSTGTPTLEPYLMLLHQPENEKTVIFIRTGLDLAL